MSLNRSEQLLFSYLEGHADERQYWLAKVQSIERASQGTVEAVAKIDSELWRYYLERSNVAPEFKAAVNLYGDKRTSMKNLAEYLVRLWIEPKPKPRPPVSGALAGGG